MADRFVLAGVKSVGRTILSWATKLALWDEGGGGWKGGGRGVGYTDSEWCTQCLCQEMVRWLYLVPIVKGIVCNLIVTSVVSWRFIHCTFLDLSIICIAALFLFQI